MQKASSTQGTRKYVVDIAGDLPTILLEIDTADGLTKKSYVYANGEVLMQHNGNYTAGKYFYLHDRLGSVREVIDANNVVVDNYTYDPFGKTIEEGETLANPFKFTGQWYDQETGHYYLRARMYDPVLMRFTSEDPVAGKFEEPLSLHKYLYCQNDPIDGIDLDGREVYWAARDLAAFPVWNHQFITCIPDDPEMFETASLMDEMLYGSGFMVDLGGGKRGFTLGGFGGMDKENSLLFQLNEKNDIAATREYYGKTSKWYAPDWDYEGHKIQAPGEMSDTDFISTLYTQAYNYKSNEEKVHMGYKKIGMNCITWANDMFRVAGVDEMTRKKEGNFSGWDMGPYGTISERYFRP